MFCIICKEVFASKSELARHLTKCHCKLILHCEVCDKLFQEESSFVKHMKCHDRCGNTVSLDCVVNKGKSILRHILSGCSKPTPCKIKTVKKLVRSKTVVNDGCVSNLWSCYLCDTTFKCLTSYNKHFAQHKTERGFDKIDASEDEIKHEIPFIVKEEMIFQCSECGKRFKLKESFKAHQRTHSGEKPYACHICGKLFGHNGGLSYHLKHVHLGIKEHRCDVCGRGFAMKSTMEDHRRIHTGERPYICQACAKSFKTKASLYIHNKTHTDEFPHTCTYCSRQFRWRQQLLGHLTTHTGEKNHVCDMCGKRFGVKNDLTRHQVIHSEAKPFSCSICGFCFAQKRYLKNHMKSRHKLKSVDL